MLLIDLWFGCESCSWEFLALLLLTLFPATIFLLTTVVDLPPLSVYKGTGVCSLSALHMVEFTDLVEALMGTDRVGGHFGEKVYMIFLSCTSVCHWPHLVVSDRKQGEKVHPSPLVPWWQLPFQKKWYIASFFLVSAFPANMNTIC